MKQTYAMLLYYSQPDCGTRKETKKLRESNMKRFQVEKEMFVACWCCVCVCFQIENLRLNQSKSNDVIRACDQSVWFHRHRPLPLPLLTKHNQLWFFFSLSQCNCLYHLFVRFRFQCSSLQYEFCLFVFSHYILPMLLCCWYVCVRENECFFVCLNSCYSILLKHFVSVCINYRSGDWI